MSAGSVIIHIENGDLFELWEGGSTSGSEYNCNNPVGHVYGYDYNESNALSQGNLINVFGKQNPLRYLFYSTNQIADHFGSLATSYAVHYGGLWNEGDNTVNSYNYGSDYYSELYNVMSTLGPPVTDQANFESSKTATTNSAYLLAIRAVSRCL